MQTDLVSYEHPLRFSHNRKSRDLTIPYSSKYASLKNYHVNRFTDLDGRNLTAYTPDFGSGWTSWTGNINIYSNVAVVKSAVSRYVINTELSDCVITARFKCGNNNGNYAPGIIFKGSSPTYYPYLYISGDGNLQIWYYNGFGYYLSTGTTWAADANWHTVVLKCSGTTITTTIDNGTPWIVTDFVMTYHGTYCGISGWMYGGLSDSFDDFVVSGTSFPIFPSNYNKMLWSDSFESLDNTHLSTRGWTETTGSWVCSSGSAIQTLTSMPTCGYIATKDIGLKEYALETKITTPSTGYFITGLAFRFIDINNFIELEINNSPTYTGFCGFGCWYFNGVQFYQIMSRYLLPQNNTVYTIRLKVQGNKIFAELVEIGLRMIGSSTLYASGSKVGLFEARDASRPNANTYDNFKIYIP